MIYYWDNPHQDKLPVLHERGPFLVQSVQLSRTSEGAPDVTLKFYQPNFGDTQGYDNNELHIESDHVYVDDSVVADLAAERIQPSVTVSLNKLREDHLVLARVDGKVMRDVFLEECPECSGTRT